MTGYNCTGNLCTAVRRGWEDNEMTSTNTLKTVALMAAMVALFMFAGYLIRGTSGMVFALVLGGLFNMGAYWFSDRIALAMNGAHEISPADAPGLYRVV